MVETRASDDQIHVITSAYDHGCREPLDVPINTWTGVGRAKVFYADTRSWHGRLSIVKCLRASGARVLYLNSLFSYWFSILPLLLVRLGLVHFDSVVVAPRGELDPGALRLKSPKKRAFLAVAKALKLYDDVTWHLSAELEAANLRAIFPTARVLVKENETLVRGRSEADGEIRCMPVRFAYLGRVSRKKRVHLLIQAAAQLPRGSYELLVFGGGDRDYIQECKDLSRKLGVPVNFSGPVLHDHVADLFDAADFACFPTAGENFGHVIAEAMARGCPVVVGDVTPWTKHVRAGGGVIVGADGDPAAWAKVMMDLLVEDAAARVERRRDALASFEAWETRRPAGSFIDQLLTLPRGSSSDV
ncbi:glycosyltransferase [Nocardioides sp. Y6]|uniref:Glycosyltransferase n=1 Tax=Nocardioides malaquae TaxID=2773426 RepID=A0ABR9RTD2_9ACTN|nr:glycosyltransferase [Nocardioides malaquae]MBE7324816.1 glycosyltransferase [Nocardioides malaquae]